MLIDGTMTFKAAHDEKRMKDPAVLGVRQRIEAVADPSIPNAVRGWRSRIRITLKDRRILENETLAAKGNSENPLTRAEVAEKALDLMGPVLGKKHSQALIDTLFHIERVPSARALRRLYSV
jgi:2-methylcitrate dehydratase PrpD